MTTLILASASETRAALLRAAAVPFVIRPARIDEVALRAAMQAEAMPARDVADTLADMKARKVADRNLGAVIIGSDQVLDFNGKIMAKAETPDAARSQLRALRGQTHLLYSAVVLYEDGRPVWRHVAEARMTMRTFSDDYLEAYLARNWDSARHSVGTYLVEAEGLRLFSRIDGDHAAILGLPMTPLLTYLGDRGLIAA